ncbi:MAG: Rrf2 family transcriptional regulator [Kiritimatiellae bacterium]|nr:Rrf2 family transcriptional regulator [Kiritimatiellia bacterium]
MITREADYAIRTIAYLASQDPDQSVSCTELAEKTDVPYRFLRKIVNKLNAANIIRSVRGRNGGICLQKPAKKISVLEVVNAVDSKGVLFNTCLGDEPGCERYRSCMPHKKLCSLQHEINRRLAGITANQLVG